MSEQLHPNPIPLYFPLRAYGHSTSCARGSSLDEWVYTMIARATSQWQLAVNARRAVSGVRSHSRSGNGGGRRVSERLPAEMVRPPRWSYESKRDSNERVQPQPRYLALSPACRGTATHAHDRKLPVDVDGTGEPSACMCAS